MSNSIHDFIFELPILDVHEHHLPEVFLNKNVGLLDLFQQSYAGWALERPYPLPSETRDEDPMLSETGEPTWEQIEVYTERSGSNHFVRNLIRGIDELYDLKGKGITQENWQDVDQQIRKRHADPQWPHQVIKLAGVRQSITDCYTNPLLDAKKELGPNYHSVLRINAFGVGNHPSHRCHNGNSPFEFAETIGVPCETFDDFCNLMDTCAKTLDQRNQVALKNALAYDRDIHFDEPDEKLARQAWRNENATEQQRKAFGDFVVDRFCAIAGELDIPMQMHLGTALIRGSHPLNVAGLIERHPKTRFLLMHLAYPWSTDLLAMAFVYRNIWIDLTWSFLLSPTHFKRALHEAIEILPDETRMMMGGDNWHAEESFATFQLARKLIAEVLQEKLDSGYFQLKDAQRLAERICYKNAEEFFDLND